MDILTLGGKLKELRKSQGLTQQALADEFNIKQDDISRYENDKQELNLSILKLYCNRFKVPADYLLGLTKEKTTEKDLRGVCDYTGLSVEAVQNIIIKDYIYIPLLADNPTYPQNIAQYVSYSYENQTYFSMFESVFNSLLSSNCLFDIVTDCCIEIVIKLAIKELSALYDKVEKRQKLSKTEVDRIKPLYQITKEYYQQHRMNRFNAQDSVVSFMDDTVEFKEIDIEKTNTMIKFFENEYIYPDIEGEPHGNNQETQ